MTCAPVGDGWYGVHKLECALRRCPQCKDRSLPVPVLEKGTDLTFDRTITHHECECNGRCAKHWCVGPVGKCPHCPDEKGKPRPKFTKKRMLTQKTAPIGVFMTDVHPNTLRKYRCHTTHVALLSKHHCIATRKEAFRSHRNGSMCTQRDYADHLVAEFNGEIQSEHFGDKPTCSMENVTL